MEGLEKVLKILNKENTLVLIEQVLSLKETDRAMAEGYILGLKTRSKFEGKDPAA